MAFWGTEVKPGKPYTHSPINGRLRLSQATLGIGIGSESSSESASQKTVVQCNVGNKNPVFLCCLFPDKSECCQLNLEFEESDEVVFSVMGPQSVHLSGYFKSLNHHNAAPDDDDDKTESYGEDIGESESERSENSEESEYGGSFIADDDGDDPLINPSSPESNDERFQFKKSKVVQAKRRRLRKKHQPSESENDDSFLQNDNTTPLTAVKILDSDYEDTLPISYLCTRKHVVSDVVEKSRKDNETEDNAIMLDGTNAATAVQPERNEEKQKHVNGVGDALMEIKESEELRKEERFPEVDHVHGKPVLEQNELAINENEEKQKHMNGVDDALMEIKESEELTKEERFPEADHDHGKLVLEQNELASNENEEKQEHVDGVDKALMEIKESEELPKEERFPEADHDLIGKLVLEQNEMASNEECKHNDLLRTAAQAGLEDGRKLKRKRKGHVKEKILKDNASKEDEGQKSESNFYSVTNLEEKETQMQINDKKRKKKKRCKNKVEGYAMKMDPHVLSSNEKNGSVVEMDSTNADENKTQLSNGIIIEDLEVGKPDGKIASLGKKVYVHYITRFKEDEQVIDSSADKTVIKFRLGGEKVQELWNVGIDGMVVGGKRRLTVPPSFCYRNEGGSQDIPPNSWVVLDVELVKIR